jgi:hypothetical protein
MAPARACFALPRPLAASDQTLHISFCYAADLCFEGNEIGHAYLGYCCLPGLRMRFILLDLLLPGTRCTIAERRTPLWEFDIVVCDSYCSTPNRVHALPHLAVLGTGWETLPTRESGLLTTHGQICFGSPAQIRRCPGCCIRIAGAGSVGMRLLGCFCHPAYRTARL